MLRMPEANHVVCHPSPEEFVAEEEIDLMPVDQYLSSDCQRRIDQIKVASELRTGGSLGCYEMRLVGKHISC